MPTVDNNNIDIFINVISITIYQFNFYLDTLFSSIANALISFSRVCSG